METSTKQAVMHDMPKQPMFIFASTWRILDFRSAFGCFWRAYGTSSRARHTASIRLRLSAVGLGSVIISIAADGIFNLGLAREKKMETSSRHKPL